MMSFNVGDSALLFIIKSTLFFPHLVKHLTNACLASSEVSGMIPHTGHTLVTRGNLPRMWVLLLSDYLMLDLLMVILANPPVFL